MAAEMRFLAAALNKHCFENLPLGVAEIHGADYKEISLGAALLSLDILSEINHFQRTPFMRWVLVKRTS